MQPMNKYNILRSLSFLLTVSAISMPVSAKRPTVNINNSETSGLNALEYVLQKPSATPSFPDSVKGLGKHLFFGVNAGGSIIGNSLSGDVKPGGNIGIRVGGWITPVHGFRVGADGGLHSVYKGTDNAWFGSVRADYLLNLSALTRGYDPRRKFELIGAAGIKLQRMRQNKVWGYNYGASASLQMRFNVAPTLYLYAEPEVSVLAGHRFDKANPWYRMSTDFSLNLGLGYRILAAGERREGSSLFRQRDDDNLYFGAGVGIFGFANGNTNIKNPIARAYVGKMFSSTSGLQIGLDLGQYRPKSTKNMRNRYLTIGSLDYVLNINNACGGYRPRDVFQTTLNLGVSGAIVHGVGTGKNNRLAPGVQLGVTGLFRLSPNWGIYIHPQVYMFANRFNEALRRSNRPMGTVDIGLRYTIGDYSRIHADTYHRYDSAFHWFINGGLGGSMFLRGTKAKGGNIYIGFGKRFTPVSSWRLNWEGNASSDYTSTTLHLDYLSSITTAMMGYNPNRVFDLQLVTGVFGGLSKDYTKPTFGLTAGLQANFRLNSALDFYVEPQIMASYGPQMYGNNRWDPRARLQIGLRYKLGTAPGVSGTLSDTPYGDKRNFAGLAIGAEAYQCKISRNRDNYNPCFDLIVGRWFSKVSGGRIVMSNDFFTRGKETKYIGSGHIDYMLNVSSLMDRNPARRFHIIGIAGVGLGESNDKNSTIGPMLFGGAQLRYNLPGNIDLHFEPAFEAWARRVVPSSAKRVAMMARMTLGASYRF